MKTIWIVFSRVIILPAVALLTTAIAYGAVSAYILYVMHGADTMPIWRPLLSVACGSLGYAAFLQVWEVFLDWEA